MQIHGESLAGRRMRKMGIKYSRFHPEARAVKSDFIAVHSLRDWTRVLDRWYAVIGRELHTLGSKPHDPAVARRLLNDIGADAGVLDAALNDSTTHDEIHDDHQRVVDAGGFGVPTLFLLGDCLFGPVLVDPPTGPRSLALWNVVTGMAGLPHVYELQRPKAPADLELIGRSLRPYLDGRDWVSINRGEVVDVERLTGRGGSSA